MHINLVPVCGPGVSYGSEVMKDALTRFRKQLLAVIIVCPEESFEYSGQQPQPDNITSADIHAAIALFREPGTIGQVTGFIHEEGMNINLTGTGGWHGEEFMKCLTQNDIQPWFYPVNIVHEKFKEWSGESSDFSSLCYDLPNHKRLEYWEKFLVDEIVPHLYTEMLGLFYGTKTGTWQESWELEEDADNIQLDAILSNTDFYQTFLSEIDNLRQLNKLYIKNQKVKITLRRQIYVSTITCLETYLSDAFINTVLSNNSYLKSFFLSFKDFQNQKFGMNNLLDFADKASDIAKKAMLEVIYHHLPKVSKMYEGTLNITFPDFSEIQKFISIRHDIVHRNGKTKEGVEIIVDNTMIDDILAKVKDFVNEIDQKLKGLGNSSDASNNS